MNKKKILFYSNIIIPLTFFVFMYIYVYHIDPYRQTFKKAIDQVVASHIYSKTPKIKYRINANFDNKIILLGYNIATKRLGNQLHVNLKLYYRALKKIDGSYKVFIHIEGKERLNKDHHPVFGLYPISQWNIGEIIEDPLNFTVISDGTSAYTVWMGFSNIKNDVERIKIINAKQIKTDGYNRVQVVVIK